MKFAPVLLAVLLSAGHAALGQARYDLLLKNGHVIDPANSIDGVMDVAVAGGKIARVQAGIPASEARKVLDVKGLYVTPGLVDLHAHVFGYSGSIFPDDTALPACTTTVVDAGGAGWRTFDEMDKRVIQPSRTRVLAFLNIVGGGMSGIDDENDPRTMDPEATARIALKYPETIVGIKTAHFQPATWDAVDRAVQAAERSKTIVMVDFHPKPGRGYPELILRHMRPGDIHTHVYGRLTPQLDAQKKLQPYMLEARRRGVLFDVGHGAGSLWFRIAAPAIQQGFLPDTISTDLHKRSVMLSRSTMTNVMSKFLAMGLSIEQVIERSTVNPAKAIRRPDLGSLEEGGAADIAVLELRKGQFAFLDSGLGKLTADKELRCVLTLRNGEVVWDPEGLAAGDWRDTGPYSNFK